MVSQSDKIVVYAYKKGQFSRNTETNGQGQSDIEFSNAMASATVGLNLGLLTLNAGTTLNVDVLVTALLPL